MTEPTTSVSKTVTSQESAPELTAIERIFSHWLESADALIYVFVAILFLLGAVATIGYSIYEFFLHLKQVGFADAIITLINDLLLVMIIMEVLNTIVSYIERRFRAEDTAVLKPFLIIGAISATRRILTIGAGLALQGEKIDTVHFRNQMIELGVSAGIILAVAIALNLLSSTEHRN